MHSKQLSARATAPTEDGRLGETSTTAMSERRGGGLKFTSGVVQRPSFCRPTVNK